MLSELPLRYQNSGVARWVVEHRAHNRLVVGSMADGTTTSSF